MLTVIVLLIVVPSVAGAAYLVLRGRLPNLVANVRGIDVHAVIVMVVLLAIAAGVAAVLINRGGEAMSDIERQQADNRLFVGGWEPQAYSLGDLPHQPHRG